MSVSMKKIATDVVASLKNLPSPEKKGKSFWDFLKEQLYSDSTWDQKDLKIIEKEIDKHLSKLEKKDLTQLWESTDAAMDKLDDGKKVDSKEMREDLTSDILGQVMDRMDDNYSGGGVYHPSETVYAPDEGSVKSKGKEEDDEGAEEKEPDELDDSDINLNDEDIFNDEDFDEDENTRF